MRKRGVFYFKKTLFPSKKLKKKPLGATQCLPRCGCPLWFVFFNGNLLYE